MRNTGAIVTIFKFLYGEIVEKVIGIGFNYENPYRDIVTTIEDFTVTDVEADKAIIDIWNEVGI